MLILDQYQKFTFVPTGIGLFILGPCRWYYREVYALMSRFGLCLQLSNSYSGSKDIPHLLIAGMGSTCLVLQYRWMDRLDIWYSILYIYEYPEYRRARLYGQCCGIGIHFFVLGSKMQGSMPSSN